MKDSEINVLRLNRKQEVVLQLNHERCDASFLGIEFQEQSPRELLWRQFPASSWWCADVVMRLVSRFGPVGRAQE